MKLLIFYKDFSKITKGVSHVGLGVTSQNTAEVLRQHRFDAEAVPVLDVKGVTDRLAHDKHVTHVVIGAAWVDAKTMEEIVKKYPNIKFCAVSHSNVGFLAIEPEAIRLLKDYKKIQDKYLNFSVGGNCHKFVKAWNEMYDTNLTLLPNLYHTQRIHRGNKNPSNTIKIGIFGSVRPLKNFVSAVGACLYIANYTCQNIEIYVSSGRDEGGATTIRAIDALVENVPNVKLIKSMWADHAAFRTLVSEMDLCMQPSYTETYNMICADSVVEGVPVVGSDAIDWIPDEWRALVDNVESIAMTGIYLMEHRQEESDKGWRALLKSVERGIKPWAEFLAL